MNAKKVTYEVVYNFQKRLDRKGEAAVYIKAYQNGQRHYRNTGIRITPDKWDEQKREVKKRPDLNRLIREIYTDMERFELNFPAQQNRSFQLSDFVLNASTSTGLGNIPSFTEFALEQIERDYAKGKYKTKTRNRYRSYIENFLKFEVKSKVNFSEINYSLIENFDYYLLSIKKYGINYAAKHHETILRYLNEASRKNLFDATKNPYNEFDIKKEKKEGIVLLPNEISILENLVFLPSKSHLNYYRDTFLLAYYTLLRIGDLRSIKRTNIHQCEQGLILELKAQKTGKINRLPLYQLFPESNSSSKPEKIIRKYMRTDNRPLFGISESKMNKYIKEIIRIAGISKHVTFHVARHSGCTFYSTVLPVSIVQQMAQHEDIKTTQGYLHISGDYISKALSQVKW